MHKLLLFGAGKIGRSFIAQLFYNSGYQVIFVDIDQKLVELLNSQKEYQVMIKGENEYSVTVSNYKALHFSEKEKILKEFSSVSLIATSVGSNALPTLFPLLAEALTDRFHKHPYRPVDIIIAENLRNADVLYADNLLRYLPADYPFNKLVGLVETSIGKMVPIMSHHNLEENPLTIFAEEYNTLPLAASGFKNPLPEIKGFSYMSNIKAWVDRKSLIHNLGHAAAAYFGYLENPGEKLLWKTLSARHVLQKTRDTMLQSAQLLLTLYPYNFTLHDLEMHIDDLLQRFQNRKLGDSVFRVGSDLFRKLGKNDRLAGAVHLACKQKQPFDLILESLVAGFHFRATDENERFFPGDEEFIKELHHSGFERMFQKIAGFNRKEHPEILQKALDYNQSFYSRTQNP